MSLPTWDKTFMDMAALIAKRSKDRSFQVGAVLVGPDCEVRSVGYNGFPRLVNDNIDERHLRPAKYLWTEHAERNAIYNAARVGIQTKGCTLYVTTAPCMRCARAIIQSGIESVVCNYEAPVDNLKDGSTPVPWWLEFQTALQMFSEAGVIVRSPCT